jgi:hypothetical protein
MTRTPLSQQFAAEIEQCATRHDLRPSESHNTGFSIEQHDRATLAAGGSNSFDLGVPGCRSPTAPDENQ